MTWVYSFATLRSELLFMTHLQGENDESNYTNRIR